MEFTSKVWEWIWGAIAHFFAMFRSVVGQLVAKVLGTFGLSLVTFNGVLPDIKAFLSGFLDDLPPAVLQLASAVGLDVAMTMIVSALTVRMAWTVFIVPTSVKDALQGQQQ